MDNQETRIEEQLGEDFIEIDYIKQKLQVPKNLLLLIIFFGSITVFALINMFCLIISNHYRILQLLFELTVIINSVNLYLINHYILKESKNKNKLSKTNVVIMARIQLSIFFVFLFLIIFYVGLMIGKWYSILILFIYISVCILIIKKERILLCVFFYNFVWLVIYILFITSNTMLTLNLNKKNFSPPIWIEDFGIDVSGREEVRLTVYTSSVLASYIDYRVFANIKGEYYYVDCQRFESKIDIIRKKAKKELIDLDHYRKIQKKDWGVESLYRGKDSDNKYYIENGDVFVVLDTGITIGKKEIQMLKEKLF